MRYRWAIKTGVLWFAGTNARPFLSLRGSRGSVEDIELNDPDALDDWERGAVNRGTFETADLGSLLSGVLRHDGTGPSPDWAPEYVRISNVEDGRVWLAAVNKTLTVNEPFRLTFRLEDSDDLRREAEHQREDAAIKIEAEEAERRQSRARRFDAPRFLPTRPPERVKPAPPAPAPAPSAESPAPAPSATTPEPPAPPEETRPPAKATDTDALSTYADARTRTPAYLLALFETRRKG